MNKHFPFIAMSLVLLSGCASEQYSNVTKQHFPENAIELENGVATDNKYKVSEKKNLVIVELPTVISDSEKVPVSVYVFNNSEESFLFSPDYMRVHIIEDGERKVSRPYHFDELRASSINSGAWWTFLTSVSTGLQNMRAGNSYSSGTVPISGSGSALLPSGNTAHYNYSGWATYRSHTYDPNVAYKETQENTEALKQDLQEQYDRLLDDLSEFKGNYLGVQEVMPGQVYGGTVLIDPIPNRELTVNILVDAGGELHTLSYKVSK